MVKLIEYKVSRMLYYIVYHDVTRFQSFKQRLSVNYTNHYFLSTLHTSIPTDHQY